MKVLLTGFDPFGGESVNPAFEAIKLLPDTIAGAEIVKVEIPTEFTRSISCVEAAIKEHNPDVVIDVGQAGGRACVTVEKVGINLADARIPDNACCIALCLVLSADCILYCRRSYPLICIKTAKIIINRISGPEILIKNGGV